MWVEMCLGFLDPEDRRDAIATVPLSSNVLEQQCQKDKVGCSKTRFTNGALLLTLYEQTHRTQDMP